MKPTGAYTSWTKKMLEREFIRFLIVGVANTAFFYATYAMCLAFIQYKLAYTVSFALSVVFSYWLNSHFVFRVKLSLSGLLRFPLVYLVQYLGGIALMYLLVDWLHLSAYLAPIIVVGLTIPVTFLLSRTLLRGKRFG
ncbi:GtrA family protein [Pandoraea pnomenusa]|uniref:GtrA family protein n=1 Tax=Pandoraea pnomenusa TaxID=93220 RepID=UPI00334110EB